MHNDQNHEGSLFEVALSHIEDRVSLALFFGEVKEVDSEKIDREEARDHLFANEESQLVLKDERSS